MSLSAYGGDDKVGGHGAAGATAAGALHAAQAPRLRSAAGGYAAWKPDMDVYLERVGADGVHKRAMTDESWRKLALQVQSWSDEALAQALASIGVEDAATTMTGAAGGTTAAASSSTKSAELTSEQKEQRRLVTALVERSRRTFGVIWAALPEDLRVQAAHVSQGFAAGLWLWLQQKFQNTEQDSVGELLAQWVALRQEEDESFDAYRARVNQIKALLEHAKEPQSARMYVFTLLDKLQPRYKQAVLALKASGQLKEADKIGWDNVAAFINQHERSELRFGADSVPEGAAMAAAARGGSSSGGAAVAGMAGQRGGYRGRRGGGNRRYEGTGDRRVCFRCNQKGHIAENCSRPPKAGSQQHAGGPSSEPGEKASAAMQLAAQTNRYGALSSDDEDVEESNHDERSCMTYAEVAAGEATVKAKTPTPDRRKTLDRKPSAEKGASSRSSELPLQQKLKTTNQTPAVTISLDLALADDAFGWDTMASSCCSGNRERFSELHKRPAVPVKLADGSIVNATHAGTVPLRMVTQSGKIVRVELHDVLYHERFASNLLSGELLTKKLGWQFHSTPTETYAVTPGGSRVNLSTRGRVAVLMSAGPERACRALTSGTGSVRDDAADQLVLLHERLCHMGWTRMMNLLHGGKVEDHGIDVAALGSSSLSSAEKRVRECVACIKGRATRTAFGHRGLDRGTRPGECLHMDTYSVKVEREGRLVQEYGLVVKDMYSGYSWHDRFLSKDEVADGIIKLVLRTETQFGCRVKRIYSDGGTEFINQKLKAFCDRSGKEWHPTPARTQQLNGAAERTVRTFKDYQRSMMQHAGGTVKLWGRAAAHAAFVWNRTHISPDTKMTPYEAMRGKKPSLRHLRAVWGCNAYCHVPKEQRNALSAKAEPCIYLGHSEVQNAAVVLLLSTKKVICSRDVTYHSSSFAFMRALELGDASVRDVLQLHDANLDEETDSVVGGQPMERATTQGGMQAAPPAAHEESSATVNSEPQEWKVESIIAERKLNGRTQYKVRWADFGSDEDSWEPESNLIELEALDVWQSKKAQPRRSPRFEAARSGSTGAKTDEEDEPQVHMAMSALHCLQLPEEQPEPAVVMTAVAAGVALLEQQTPRTFREAMASSDADKWKAALDKEYRSCLDQEVWELVPRNQLPSGANVLPCKEVFKIKVDELGQPVEHKARFTPKGFRQKRGVDFFETFARTGQYKTLRVALSLVAKWDHELIQFDVPTAFLNASVEEDIYMELPEGYEQSGMVCKLKKALYGLKQAPRNWDKLVHGFITRDMGFKATVSDPSLYFKRSRSGRLMMIYRFVDDMQGSHHMEDKAEFQQSVKLLQDRFRIKQLQTATWMLGMRILRDRKARTITLDQELYVTKALEKFGLEQCRVVSTPEAVGAAHDTHPSLDQPTDRQCYMEMTGTLMYAAISTRPDIAHAVHYLASHMQEPRQRHMQAAERVFRYLAGTKDLGLVFGSRNGDTVGDSRGRKAQVQVDVCAFSDADWANDKGDRKSVSGWVAKLNGDPVSWSSKKQRVVALSTCEAELYAEAAAIQEVLWLRGLMEELGLHTQTGSIVYGDNQSTLAVSENGVKGARTKHVDVKYHFVTETVEQGSVKLRWVPTTQQQADLFTKALAAPPFESLRKQLMTR
jgi:transposase InsO family protein